jgi:antitoxin Phd
VEKQYTIVDAKNKLPSLIHYVETGQTVKLTRYGKPVAVLLSIKDYKRLSRKREGY